MTIRFATANRGSAIIARSFHAPAKLCPANDNREIGDDRVLWAALRHFARHGLAAAMKAADSAQAALEAGDQDGFKWWLAICRTLDRRIGETLTRQAPAAS
jgi:hypothetical protein